MHLVRPRRSRPELSSYLPDVLVGEATNVPDQREGFHLDIVFLVDRMF